MSTQNENNNHSRAKHAGLPDNMDVIMDIVQ